MVKIMQKAEAMRYPLLSPLEVAEMLNVSVCTIYRLKDLPPPWGIRAYRVGRCIRFTQRDVEI